MILSTKMDEQLALARSQRYATNVARILVLVCIIGCVIQVSDGSLLEAEISPHGSRRLDSTSKRVLAVTNGTTVTLDKFPFGGAEFTVETWALFNNMMPMSSLIYIGNDFSDYISLEFSLDKSFQACVQVQSAPSKERLQCAAMLRDIPMYQWIHIAMVRSVTPTGASINLYIDGQLEATQAVPVHPVPLHKTHRHYIFGKHPLFSNTNVDAIMDDTRLWSVARNGNDIRNTMVAGVTPGSPEAAGLEASYLYDETGSTITDSSGKGTIIVPRDGTVHCVFSDESCRISMTTPKSVCGDAKRGVDTNGELEECDDGNTNSGDGCSSTCTIETNWFCSPSLPGSSDICVQGTREIQLNFDDLTTSGSGWSVSIGQNGSWLHDGDARYTGSAGLRLYQPPMYEVGEHKVPRNGLYVWMRSDFGVTSVDTEDGPRVTSWRDAGPMGWVMQPEPETRGPKVYPNAYNGYPSIRFEAEQDTTLRFTSDDCYVPNKYTMILLTRVPAPSSGRLVVSRSGNNFIFGPYHDRIGWHSSGTGWVQWSGRSGYSIWRVGAEQFHLQIGVCEPNNNFLYRDGTTAGYHSGTMSSPGRLGLGMLSDGRGVSRQYGEIIEWIIYNRTISTEERRNIEMYIGEKYGHHSVPAMQIARELFASNPTPYATYGSKVLSNSVTINSYLKAMVNVPKQPRRWGLPLGMTIFAEGMPDVASVAPSPWECTNDNGQCGGRDFYTICFNGGNKDYIQCDEYREQPLNIWESVQLHIVTLFRRKYGVNYDLDRSSRIRVMLTTVASDDSTESYVDSMEIVHAAPSDSCDAMTVLSAGSLSYSAMMSIQHPFAYWRFTALNGNTYNDLIASYPGTVVGTVTATNNLVRPNYGDSDPSIALDVSSAYVISDRMQKVDPLVGFTVSFWLQISGTPITGASNVWVPLVSDRASSSNYTFCIEMNSNRQIRAVLKTTFATDYVISDSSISPNEAQHIAMTWNAGNGLIKLYIGGERLGDDEVTYNANYPGRNIGDSALTAKNPIRIGYDGQFSFTGGTSAASTVISFDEVAFFTRPLTNGEIYKQATPIKIADELLQRLQIGGSILSAAMVQIGETIHRLDPSYSGFTLWVFDESQTLINQKNFNVAATTTDELQTALDDIQAFIVDDNEVPIGSTLAGALKFNGAPTSVLLMKEDFDNPRHGADSIHQRLYHYEEGYYHTYTMDNDAYADNYDRTHADAHRFCEDMGQVLCSYDDYCWVHGRHESFNPYIQITQVEGEGWAPIADEDNEWTVVGRAYADRVCRTYSYLENAGVDLSWDRTTGTPPANSFIMCCQRVNNLPKWREVNEVPEDGVQNTEFTLLNVNPGWRSYLSRLDSDSHYVGYPTGRSYWTNPESTSVRCTGRLLGTYVIYDTPEAFEYTDYTLEVDVYTGVRDTAILFRWQDEAHFYGYTWNPDPRSDHPAMCHTFYKINNPSNQRRDGVSQHQRVWTDPIREPSRQNTWMRVRLDVYGTTYTIYYDGVKVEEWEDTSGEPFTRGTFGFWTGYNANALFDNVRLYSRKPVYPTAANNALRFVGMPPIPFRGPFDDNAEEYFGANYAGIGRKLRSGAELTDVPVPGAGLATIIDHRTEFGAESNLDSFPSARSLIGDGIAEVTTLFPCSQQNIKMPSNARSGAIYPLPLTTLHNLHSSRTTSNFYVASSTSSDYYAANDPASSTLAEQTGNDMQSTGSISPFSVSPWDGTLRVENSKFLGGGAGSAHNLTISGSTVEFDSGYFTMLSMSEESEGLSFRAVELPPTWKAWLSSRDPALMDVRVTLRAADGPNQGIEFDSFGSTSWQHYTEWNRYGGLQSGYNGTHVRLYAPTYERFTRGSIISLGVGAGAVYDQSGEYLYEKNVQRSHTAEVRVRVSELAAPDFDTGWFYMGSQRAAASFREVRHNFQGYPSRVRVLSQAVEGPNAGYVFEGRGDAMKYRHYSRYGGVVYGYNAEFVRLWLPDCRNAQSLSGGFGVLVGEGFGYDRYHQESRDILVRVMAWRGDRRLPDFNSIKGRTEMISGQDAYAEIPYKIAGLRPAFPGRMQTLVHTTTSDGLVFPALPMHGNTAWVYSARFSGVLSARNATAVRLWAPGPDISRAEWRSTNHVPLRVQDGWGGEVNAVNRYYVQVEFQSWITPHTVQDNSELTISINSVNEPPRIYNAYLYLPENTGVLRHPAETLIHTLEMDSPRPRDDYSFSLVAGNAYNAFTISDNGDVLVSNASALNYEVTPKFNLTILITDSIFSNIGIVEIELTDENDQIIIYPKNLTVPENSRVNTILRAVEPGQTELIDNFDEDITQTKLYSIVDGNIGDAFAIDPCNGQVRIETANINYELLDLYHLRVRVEDDGRPNITWAETDVFVFITDVNDPPTISDITIDIDENSLAGSLVGALNAADEDNDPLYFDLNSGDPDGFFSYDISSYVDDPNNIIYDGHPVYSVYLSDKVVNWGDGSGRTDLGYNLTALREVLGDLGTLVVDYENTATDKFVLYLTVRDKDPLVVDFEAHSATAFITVNVNDRNDAPVFDAPTRSVLENTPHGTAVIGSLQSSASDQDVDDTLTFSILEDENDAIPFVVHENGTLSVDLVEGPVSELDYESQKVWTAHVRVSDTGGPEGASNIRSIVRILTIVIVDVNEPPVLTPKTFEIGEHQPPGTLLGMIMAVDPDEGDTVTYEILNGDDTNIFAIVGSNGTITLQQANVLDYLTKNLYILSVVARDSQDLESTAENITINVYDMNDPPRFTSCPSEENSDIEFEISANTSAIAGMLIGPHRIRTEYEQQEAVFEYSAGIDFADATECEQACESDDRCAAFGYFGYDYWDASFHGQCYGRTAFLSVRDTSSDSINITSGYKRYVCDTINILETATEETTVGDPLTISDPEGDFVTLRLASGGISNPEHAFRIEQNGQLLVNRSDYFDYRYGFRRFLVEVIATDDSSDKATSSTFLAVYIEHVNFPPTVEGGSLFVAELDTAGTLVGDPIVGSDPDEVLGDVIHYSITNGNELNTFAINEFTGQIRLLRKIETLESETHPFYQLTVQVADSEYTDTATVNISVLTTNTRPIITNANEMRSVPESSAPGVEILPGMLYSDAQNDDATWILSDSYPSYGLQLFGIDPVSGVIFVQTTLQSKAKGFNFECDRTDPLINCPDLYRIYNLTIIVSDHGVGNLSNHEQVIVELTDVNEVPVGPNKGQIWFQVPELSLSGAMLMDAVLGGNSNGDTSYGSVLDIYDDDKTPLAFTIIGGTGASVVDVVAGNASSVYEAARVTPSYDISSWLFTNEFPPLQAPIFTVSSAFDGLLDYESQNEYTLSLQVSDGTNPAVSFNAKLEVTDVHETPVLHGSGTGENEWTFDVAENVAGRTVVGTISATDPDGDSLRFAITDIWKLRSDDQWVQEEKDSSTGLFLETFSVELAYANGTRYEASESAGGGPSTVVYAQLLTRTASGGRRSVIDFEEYKEYNVTVVVYDRDELDVDVLYAPAHIVVHVEDRNDMVITQVETPAGALQTTGGGNIVIYGSNLGPAFIRAGHEPNIQLSFGCTRDAEDMDAPSFAEGDSCTLRDKDDPYSTTCIYSAINCQVLIASARVSCQAPEGAGRGYIVRLTISSPTSGITHVRHSALNCAASSGSGSGTTGQTVTYAAPVLNQIKAPLLQTKGGESVQFIGTNFGPYGTALRAHYTNSYHRFLATNCEVSNHTHASCRSMAGVGRDHWWQIMIAEQPSLTQSEAQQQGKDLSLFSTSYKPPVIAFLSTSVSESISVLTDFDTRGQENIFLNGDNFGPTPTFLAGYVAPGSSSNSVYETISARLSNSVYMFETTCAVTKAHVQVLCSTPGGIGANFTWTALVAAQRSDPSLNMTSYHVPAITRLSGVGARGSPTRGGAVILVHGDYFGGRNLRTLSPPSHAASTVTITTIQAVDALKYGLPERDENSKWFSAVSCIVTEDQIMLQCFSAPGTGTGHWWKLSLGGQLADIFKPNPATYYAQPYVVMTDGEAHPAASTPGGEIIQIIGNNFGADNDTLDEVLLSTVSPTELLTMNMTQILLDMSSSSWNSSSTRIRVYNLSSSCFISDPHVELTCVTTEGAGTGMSFYVTIDSLVSETRTTSYRRPNVISVSGIPSDGLHTRGGDILTIHGSDFATANPLFLDYVGYGAAQGADSITNTTDLNDEAIAALADLPRYLMRAGIDCNVTEDHVEIVCVTPPGVGRSHTLVVNVFGQRSDNFGEIPYAIPEILEILLADTSIENDISVVIDPIMQPNRTLSNLPTIGITVRLVIANAGTRDQGFNVMAALDPNSKVPASASYAMTNCFDGINLYGFDIDTLHSIYSEQTGQIYSPDSPVPNTAPYCVDVTIPASDGIKRKLYVSSGGQRSNSTLISFSDPYIKDIAVLQDSNKFGQRLLQYEADAFIDAEIQVPYPSEDIPANNGDFRILVLSGRDFGPSGELLVYVGADITSDDLNGDGILSSSEIRQRYEAEIQTYDLPAQAGSVHYLYANSGSRHVAKCIWDIPGNFSITNTLSLGWNHGSIACLFPKFPGVNDTHTLGNAIVVAGIDHQVSNVVQFQQLSPEIYRVSRTTAATRGGQDLTVWAKYIGSADQYNSISVEIGGRKCEFLPENFREVTDDDVVCAFGNTECQPRQEQRARITCTIPIGQGKSEGLVVRRLRTPSAAVAFGYEPPEITDVVNEVYQSAGYPTSAGDLTQNSSIWITVRGRNFGPDPIVRFNDDTELSITTNMVRNLAADHSSLQFELVPGQGIDIPINILAKDQLTKQPGHIKYGPPHIVMTENFDGIGTQGSGDTLVGIRGFNFGFSGTLRVGGELMTPVIYTHYYVAWYQPLGEGKDLAVVLQVSGQLSTTEWHVNIPSLPSNLADPIFSYEPPVWYSVAPLSGPTTGINETTGDPIYITIIGDNFGRKEHMELYYGGEEVQEFEGHDEWVRFRVPEGQGTKSIQLNAANQGFNSLPAFEYDLPQLYSISPSSLRTDVCLRWETATQWTNRRDASSNAEGARERWCCNVQTVTFTGKNFGVLQPTVRVGDEIVHESCAFYDDPTLMQFAQPGCVRRQPCIVSHDHFEITIRAVPGQGYNHSVYVEMPVVYDLDPIPLKIINTSSVGLNYMAPRIDQVTPYPFDSRSDSLRVRGTNLGEDALLFRSISVGTGALSGTVSDGHGRLLSIGQTWPDDETLDMLIDEQSCLKLYWERDDTARVYNGMPYLICETGNIRVGAHNLTIMVAGLTAFVPSEIAPIYSLCPPEWWGQEGELCLSCPNGAICPGDLEEPYSQPKFWREDIPSTSPDFTNENLCPIERQERTECPFFAGCMPDFACTGNNTCAEGYTDVRCSKCVRYEYYRVAGECIPCPKRPWLTATMFAAGLIALCAAAYWVNKKNLSLALIAIGIDYFQVLAIFSRSRVAWPSEIKEMLRIMQFAMISIDIAAPECMLPDLDFRVKWFATLALPIAAAVFLIVLFYARYIFKRLIHGQAGDTLHRYKSTVISMFVTMMYVLYLLLARTTLDVFACNPTNPPDPRGTLYMESTNLPCYVPGGVHMSVLPWAILSLVVYVIGYPAFVGYFLYRNRVIVKQDQYLRSMGLSYDTAMQEADSKAGRDFRARYSKLYYYFSPSQYIWVLVIIGRKFFLSMTSLLFRGNASFQMATSLLVVFYAFVLQVKYQPFLCAATAHKVSEYHERQVVLGSRLHQRIDIELRKARDKRNDAISRKLRSGGAWQNETAKIKTLKEEAKSKSMAGTILVNYNTVDGILLACAVLINLSGLMFESGQFARADQTAYQSTLAWQVVTLLVLSIIYYVISFAIELISHFRDGSFKQAEAIKREYGSLWIALGHHIWRKLAPHLRKCRSKSSEARLGKHARGYNGQVNSDLMQNPMMAPKQDSGLMHNPLMGGAGDSTVTLTEEQKTLEDLPADVPHNALWRAYLNYFKDLREEEDKLRQLFTSKETSNGKVKPSTVHATSKPMNKKGVLTMSNPYRSATALLAGQRTRRGDLVSSVTVSKESTDSVASKPSSHTSAMDEKKPDTSLPAATKNSKVENVISSPISRNTSEDKIQLTSEKIDANETSSNTTEDTTILGTPVADHTQKDNSSEK